MIIIQKIVFLDQFGPLGIKIKTWTQNELYGLVVLLVPTYRGQVCEKYICAAAHH
jgi:hypothetical protein